MLFDYFYALKSVDFVGRDKLFSNYFILSLKYFMIDPCFYAFRRVYIREGLVEPS